MGHKKRIQKGRVHALAKALEARASKLLNFHGLRPTSSPVQVLCQELHSTQSLCFCFSKVCSVISQLCEFASPFPPDFGLFFALPASFVAAIGLPLRLFVPQAAEKSRPRHPRAPRRRMSSRMVRNSENSGQMRPLLPSPSTATVRFLSHNLPVSCVENYFPCYPIHAVFRPFAPLFHNIGICASPFPPVFGLLSPSLPLSLLRLGYLCACSFAR